MPNIELHGFTEIRGRELFFQIKAAMEKEEFFEDIVITLCIDVVADFKDNQCPFIRICTTSTKQEERLIEILSEKNIDVEVLPVKKFIPAKK